MFASRLWLGIFTCLSFACNAMHTTIDRTEEVNQYMPAHKLNRLRPDTSYMRNQLKIDRIVVNQFEQEFYINPTEIVLSTMSQENTLTLQSIDVEHGKKITRKIILKQSRIKN